MNLPSCQTVPKKLCAPVQQMECEDKPEEVSDHDAGEVRLMMIIRFVRQQLRSKQRRSVWMSRRRFATLSQRTTVKLFTKRFATLCMRSSAGLATATEDTARTSPRKSVTHRLLRNAPRRIARLASGLLPQNVSRFPS